MNKLTWTIFITITVGFLALIIINAKKSSDSIDVSSIDVNTVQTANDQNGNIADNAYGNTDSKVLLIEYADFQCPACATEQTVIKAILEDYKDKIQYVFRNFPLPYHTNAKAAAAAAQAAGFQGKYWDMHDKLYSEQDNWVNLTGSSRTDAFKGYAEELGLDIDKFVTDMGDKSITTKITYDKALGTEAKVDATPSFYLNGTKLSSDIWGDNDKFRAAIDAELAKTAE